MPIPKSREELTDLTRSTFEKLSQELDAAGPRAGKLPCVDDWTVKDLLAVRAWWGEHVVAWIGAGRRGETPVTPAEGYPWKETPRLNADIVRAARRESYRSVVTRLHAAYDDVMRTIDQLDDRRSPGGSRSIRLGNTRQREPFLVVQSGRAGREIVEIDLCNDYASGQFCARDTKGNPMRLTSWATLVLAICFVSCAGGHDSHDTDQVNPSEEAGASHGAPSDGPGQASGLNIPLNDGSKWAMDDHTRSMFQAMTVRVEAGGNPGEVAKGLQTDLEKLIQGCTMTGEAHDQLHVFLMAYMPAVRDVAENGSTESFAQVQDLLHEYPNYFE